MLKHLSQLKKNSNDEEQDYNNILEELERSYSSIQNLNCVKIKHDKNKKRSTSPENEFVNRLRNDQFQSLQLAEMLEKMALELRIFCKGSSEVPPARSRKKIPAYVTENIFLITLLWQLLCIGILEVVDVIWREFEKTEKAYYYTVIICMVVFQFTNLVLSMAVTIKLTKQYMHKTASMGFLLQSYVATLFLFSGMYTFLAKIDPKFFKGLHAKKESNLQSLKLFAQLLFMSVSTGTLCGASSVTALHVSTEICMSIQMLLSFIYFTSILSQAVNPVGKKSKTALHRILMQQNDQLLEEYASKVGPKARGRSCETI